MVLARRSLLSRSRAREELDICRKKRTNRMLIAMVVIFAICWLPLNVVHIIAEFQGSQLSHYTILFLSTHVIAMSSTVYNPFLYSWLNDNFRKEFQKLVPCLFKICRCFNYNRIINSSTQSTNIADGDWFDRSSTHQMLVESTTATYKQQYPQMKYSMSNERLNNVPMKVFNNQNPRRSSLTDEASKLLIPQRKEQQQEILIISTNTNSNNV